MPLIGERWVIGRSADCEITLPDPTVSRRHLLLERRRDGFWFRDLGGANPILLHGRPCRKGQLPIGQPVVIGLTQLVLEERRRPEQLATSQEHTVVLSREVVDEELQDPQGPDPRTETAADVLQRLQWACADLGDLRDAAEPLLDLALGLTDHQAGWIARFPSPDTVETLAALALDRDRFTPEMPEQALADARRIGEPHLLTTREHDRDVRRLVVPLGDRGDGLLVLERPGQETPDGQALLRLAHALGRLVSHRLNETMERLRLREELERLRFYGTDAHNALLTSSRLQAAREAARSRANAADALLLVGEPGTEKEELARYLHAESERRDRPFVVWNPRKSPAARHAADLFGDGGRLGLVRRADGGTLFVDDVVSLAHELQQRLVAACAPRADGEAGPTVLVLACDAPDADGGLAPALRERLLDHLVPIPPLREQPQDVMALAELFLSELGTCPDGSPRLISERSKRLLTAHDWPGNVRELRLTIEAAAATAGSQPIAPRHLPRELASAGEHAAAELPSLEHVEREHIRAVMQRCGGVRTRAAQILGIATSTLYEKLKKYGID